MARRPEHSSRTERAGVGCGRSSEAKSEISVKTETPNDDQRSSNRTWQTRRHGSQSASPSVIFLDIGTGIVFTIDPRRLEQVNLGRELPFGSGTGGSLRAGIGPAGLFGGGIAALFGAGAPFGGRTPLDVGGSAAGWLSSAEERAIWERLGRLVPGSGPFGQLGAMGHGPSGALGAVLGLGTGLLGFGDTDGFGRAGFSDAGRKGIAGRCRHGRKYRSKTVGRPNRLVDPVTGRVSATC